MARVKKANSNTRHFDFLHAGLEAIRPHASLHLRFDFADVSEHCDIETQIWDPVYRNCYNLTCGFLYSNINGACHYRNITLEKTRYIEADENCTLVKLKAHEVR